MTQKEITLFIESWENWLNRTMHIFRSDSDTESYIALLCFKSFTEEESREKVKEILTNEYEETDTSWTHTAKKFYDIFKKNQEEAEKAAQSLKNLLE